MAAIRVQSATPCGKLLRDFWFGLMPEKNAKKNTKKKPPDDTGGCFDLEVRRACRMGKRFKG
jgi:hypothetical protein